MSNHMWRYSTITTSLNSVLSLYRAHDRWRHLLEKLMITRTGRETHIYLKLRSNAVLSLKTQDFIVIEGQIPMKFKVKNSSQINQLIRTHNLKKDIDFVVFEPFIASLLNCSPVAEPESISNSLTKSTRRKKERQRSNQNHQHQKEVITSESDDECVSLEMEMEPSLRKVLCKEVSPNAAEKETKFSTWEFPEMERGLSANPSSLLFQNRESPFLMRSCERVSTFQFLQPPPGISGVPSSGRLSSSSPPHIAPFSFPSVHSRLPITTTQTPTSQDMEECESENGFSFYLDQFREIRAKLLSIIEKESNPGRIKWMYHSLLL